ncbi:thioester reductase domain-containing protein [Streptomyces sp. HUCO-GS316]|uniref:thioester reductase domain-containing protein n=1 Tax=Streptomyces sp. HUCO-GS316 TaxID=2692198 RepID=UPI001F3856A9|nr:thioester reductase domain-containing protein [Streptomyces sp. HUCO-GS316]
MREVNEDASAYAGQRATAEAIERGGGRLGVNDLLAKVAPTGPPDQPPAASSGARRPDTAAEPPRTAGSGPVAGPSSTTGSGAGAAVLRPTGSGGGTQWPAGPDGGFAEPPLNGSGADAAAQLPTGSGGGTQRSAGPDGGFVEPPLTGSGAVVAASRPTGSGPVAGPSSTTGSGADAAVQLTTGSGGGTQWPAGPDGGFPEPPPTGSGALGDASRSIGSDEGSAAPPPSGSRTASSTASSVARPTRSDTASAPPPPTDPAAYTGGGTLPIQGTGAGPLPTQNAEDLAAVIAAMAGRHLPEGHLSPDADFFDAGGSSVNAVELVAELEDELGMELDLDEVFADARPRSLARRWLQTTGATALPAPPLRTPLPPPTAPATVLPRPHAAAPHTAARREDLDQILADLALADRLPFTGSPEPLPPRRILLTGATGFLGSHMLLDLLRHSDAQVYCLVRASDQAAAVTRLGEALRSYGLPWSSEVRRRITVLPGDIRRPHLGLSDDLWHRLAHDLDSVVGVAAAVDFLRGYPSLRSSNVLGALTLAELAATGRPKPLHHISSIAVFNEVGITSMGEDDPLAHVDRLIAGYDQTKWAAEVALRRARDHGLVVTALRPGGIGGHTKTGAYNPQDLSSGLISAFGRFRTVPAFRYLNAAPVDWVSRTAVGVICEPDAWGFDYNLTGVPNTLDDVVRDMALGGMHVRVQDWDEWRADALARLEADPVPELAFLARVLQSPTALRLCEATLKGPAATMDRTAALTEALGLAPAARYDARAQLRTFEKLAHDGLARLPHKDDQPYLWFSETTEGGVRPIGTAAPASPCATDLTLSIASMHQLVTERRMDARGELRCPAVHPDPLTVERGDVWIRPEEGIPQQHGLRHQLLCYRLQLRDADGGRWWLEGRKYARARRDLWRQTRALSIEIGREGEVASLAGEVVVPADSYVRDQIDGIKVDPRLTSQEKRAAKLTWLAWFGLEMGRGLLGPFARAAADLLDLRRPQTSTEHNR